jgi:hypothetical protein
MQAGAAQLKTPGLRFLLTGLSWSRLDFLRPGESVSKSSIIIDQGDERAAYRCEGCGIVTIYPFRNSSNVPGNS